ncbi:MAG: superfamily endonuclease [Verrucomicrobiota bacterium]|jgi:hypothetical protein|nr:superfamily endonuclease [Verrucomicrobiota bacterium]MDK2964209.1 superfamily endonuclease [Verrucomicrobiota bacterium]
MPKRESSGTAPTVITSLEILLPQNLHLVQLPACSPEFNPIERLWDVAKDPICNRIFKTLDAIEENRLKPFARTGENQPVRGVWLAMADCALRQPLRSQTLYPIVFEDGII